MSRQSGASTRQGAAAKPTQSVNSLFSTSRSAAGRSATGQLSVQRQANGNAVQSNAAAAVRGTVEQPGRPLDAETRSQMEPHLGYDLSSVRVHTDQDAASSARAVHAGAYTTGSHIAFDTGRYTPGTLSGQQLMAHELTHVVQQSQGPVAGSSIGDGVQVSHPSDSFEREAKAAGDSARQARAEGAEGEATRRIGPSSSNGGGADGLSIQRADPTSGEIRGQTDSAEASAAFAGISAITGIIGVVYAAKSADAGKRQADAAERQTEAAEDPPAATPTTGGLTFTHADVPATKKLKTNKEAVAKRAKAEGRTPKADAAEDDSTSLQDDPDVTETEKTKEKSQTVAGKKPKTTSTTETETKTEKVRKDADKTTAQSDYTLLRISQRKGAALTDYATFGVTLFHNGEDITGGSTDDQDREGYLGGTHNANANVNFKAQSAAQAGDEGAAVNVKFSGTNVPARSSASSSGLYSGGAPALNANYQIQSFSGLVKFQTAIAGDKPVLVPTRMPAKVKPGSPPATFDGLEGKPFYHITFDTSAARRTLSDKDFAENQPAAKVDDKAKAQ